MTQSDRYLGLPMAIGNSKVNTFKDLQEKITKRVMGWKERFISKAGREILIKTVAQNGGMGFRDLHSFNLAMLSKQAWRLIEDTQSLFYKVYKARYFPNGSFIKAELGSNPSFVWRSLLATRDILVAGSYWQVGDGRTIGDFSHKWLSHTPIPLDEVSHELWVCDLIDEDARQWDRGKL
ncbi:putative mitochondrial protein AtMg00310 [Castanea sativa]|uniref:putative mitochondrial protein AtMg00310 n=1 Tax=Castanea sativa TaxID=21020 RepID=UPI003F6521A2